MRIEAKRMIDGSPAEVWAVLTDLDGWSEWNPHIFQAAGKPVVGQRLDLKMWQGEPTASAAKNKTQRFRPTVLVSDDASRLVWEGRLAGVPGLFTGRHSFELTEISGRTELVHSEEFGGVLVRPFAKMLSHLPATFALVNDKLAERVEAVR